MDVVGGVHVRMALQVAVSIQGTGEGDIIKCFWGSITNVI